MRALFNRARAAAEDILDVQTRDELSAIGHPGCAAVLWRRAVDPDFQRWIDGLAPSLLPSMRAVLRPDAVRDAVAEVCDAQGTPNGAARAWFLDDVAALAVTFADVMGAPYVRARLDVVTDDACRKFHIDVVTARLICTYRGPGSVFGIGSNGAPPQSAFTAPTAAPILMRGRLWRGDAPSSLLHRSPQIEGTGQTRLLFVLDPVQDPRKDGV